MNLFIVNPVLIVWFSTTFPGGHLGIGNVWGHLWLPHGRGKGERGRCYGHLVGGDAHTSHNTQDKPPHSPQQRRQ